MKTLFFIIFILFIFIPSHSQNCYPVVDIEYGFLLGNENCDYSTHAYSLTGGEDYKLYALSGYAEMGVGDTPRTWEGPCKDQLYVEMTYPETDLKPVI